MIKDLLVKNIKGKGKGVFSIRNFRKGDFIFRSRKGSIIHPKDIPQLPKEQRNHINQVSKGVFELQCSPECYINHSCNPNTIWKGKTIYAYSAIKKGDELTTDYRIGALNEGWKMKCKCGSKNCMGIVEGDFFTLPYKIQKRYLCFAPDFVQKEYKKRRGMINHI
jgi:hypothetical protein